MSDLTEVELRALHQALDDEYRAWATYDQVIADFGAVPPFINIREAEARHIEALLALFARYGLAVPENPWRGKTPRYGGLQQACEAGVDAEIANREMYERLLKATERADILTVFRNLQAASQQRHLPAFRRCAERGRPAYCRAGLAGARRGRARRGTKRKNRRASRHAGGDLDPRAMTTLVSAGAPGVAPFVRHHQRYEDWFERHRAAYLSELLAVRALLPLAGRGLEIGVGTGRFAGPLGVAFGIDPATEMLSYAQTRGVCAASAVAEALPFAPAAFDYALIVTTICFVRDARAMLTQARHVLKPGGELVIGFIDRTSDLGRDYLAHQAESVFYREARFYSADEVERLLADSGFSRPVWAQTLYKPLPETHDIEPVHPGRGQGAFVVVRAIRP